MLKQYVDVVSLVAAIHCQVRSKTIGDYQYNHPSIHSSLPSTTDTTHHPSPNTASASTFSIPDILQSYIESPSPVSQVLDSQPRLPSVYQISPPICTGRIPPRSPMSLCKFLIKSIPWPSCRIGIEIIPMDTPIPFADGESSR